MKKLTALEKIPQNIPYHTVRYQKYLIGLMFKALPMLMGLILFFSLLTFPFLKCGQGGPTLGESIIIQVSPQSINFGTIPVNTVVSQDIKVSHIGESGKLIIESIYFKEGSSPEFSFDMPSSLKLLPKEETIIKVKYAPKDSLPDSATLVISHNAPPSYVSSVSLSALAQEAYLITEPSPIDFGGVLSGSSKSLNITIKNAGSDTFIVNETFLDEKSSKDFKIEKINATFPLNLLAYQKFELTMSYTPKGGDEDEGYLSVRGITKGEPQEVSFTCRGNELGPEINVSPGILDFGWVILNKKEVKELTIYNEGLYDLEVKEIYPSFGSDKGIKIEDFSGSFNVKPKEFAKLKVSWQPQSILPPSSEPIGGIVIVNNDSDEGTIIISVFGRVDAPLLIVTPPDTVDFGYVAQNMQVERTITLNNAGHAPLEIYSIEFIQPISSEFEIKNPFTGTISPETAEVVTLSFKNKGGDKGEEKGKLKIKSSSPGKEEIIIDLVAKRAGSPTCDIVLSPLTLNFGVVPMGFYKKLPMLIINKGTGFCSFQNARIEDCVSFPGFGGMCSKPKGGMPSKTFTIILKPPAIENGIEPGKSYPIEVLFKPPKTTPLFGAITEYFALLSVDLYNPYTKETITYPKPSGISSPWGEYKANLYGGSGIAKITVIPPEINFGIITIGCHSKIYKVTVYNAGSAPLTISSVELSGCTPEFKIKNIPPLPKDVTTGVPFPVELQYIPQDLGKDSCMLVVKSTDESSPVLSVSLEGEGTYDTEWTDIFHQVSGQEVDVLFVIDDSGSMCEEQERLAQNFEEFIKFAEIWKNDFHLGVISVNVVNEKVMAKLNLGKKKPRFLTPQTQDYKNKFKEFVKLGCGGGSDPQEAGLQAAQMALSLPLTYDTDVPCSSDNDCLNNKNVCADPKNCPIYCIDGFCGGWNAKFLRENAQLEIIFLSDEEDQSPATVSFYIDFFKNIKGFYNVNMMHAHSIVGPNGGCVAPDGGGADAGKRYMEVSKETGGKIESICNPTFAPVLNDIGAIAFGLKVQFFLTRIADPPTIKVWINGNECKGGNDTWSFDIPSNSVIFVEKGKCMPQPNDEIKVYYKTLCLQE